MRGRTGKQTNLGGVKPQQLRDLLRTLRKRGWDITDTGSDHLKLTPPGGGPAIYSSRTSSDVRMWKNLRAQLRRAGEDL